LKLRLQLPDTLSVMVGPRKECKSFTSEFEDPERGVVAARKDRVRPTVSALSGLSGTNWCESAWGPNADRRGNLLKFLLLVGSHFGA